jgi:Fe-S-cluster containining protein
MKTVNPDNPTSWMRYRKSMCDTCRATCCTLPVEVSVPDLIRLGLIEEEEAVFEFDRMVKRLKKEGWIQRYSPKTQIFVLQQKNGTDCIFLDENRRCTVYSDRPQVCRSFPRSVGSRPGYCPYLPK